MLASMIFDLHALDDGVVPGKGPFDKNNNNTNSNKVKYYKQMGNKFCSPLLDCLLNPNLLTGVFYCLHLMIPIPPYFPFASISF